MSAAALRARSPRATLRDGELSFAAASTAFAAAAVVVAAINAVAPFARGWWLVAYLVLVGGAAQLLLGVGQFVLVHRLGIPPPRRGLRNWQLALWNLGTIVVAAADVARAPVVVACGSISLALALVLFASVLRSARRDALRRAAGLERGYQAVIAFMAVSVVVGTLLAGAHGTH